jgi:Protein of unknown function (DUF1579)
MKTRIIAVLTAALTISAAALLAQEPPQMPPPVKEHEWLQQLAGEWESEVEIFMVPGQPSIKGKGTESARMMGGFWLIGEGTGEMMGMKMTNMLTLGYDPEKKKYVGTWADSMSSYLWKYTGTVDADGKKLTLDTEGPCPMKPGVTSKFKEVIEIKDKDHKVFTSSILGDDGKWTTMIIAKSTRKK